MVELPTIERKVLAIRLKPNLLLESVPLHSGQKILDIATGTGLIAIPAAQKVGSQGYVIGIDMSPGMLHQARLKVEAASLQNIELIQADADYINFSDSSFDTIFCCEAIMFLTDIPTSLQKWYCFLKQGGFVAFTRPPKTAYMASVYKNICAKLLCWVYRCHTSSNHLGLRKSVAICYNKQVLEISISKLNHLDVIAI